MPPAAWNEASSVPYGKVSVSAVSVIAPSPCFSFSALPGRFQRTSQVTIKHIGKCLAVGLRQRRRPATLYAAGTHGVHEVADIQARTHVVAIEQLATRCHGHGTARNHVSGQRNIL